MDEINIVENYDHFYYKSFNLFCKYQDLKNFFKDKKINYKSDDTGIEIEKSGIGIYIPDIDVEDPDKEEGPVIVKAIGIDFNETNCSISFERLTSHHIPSKVTYENSNISSAKSPAIRMNYEEEKYLASHGKSKKTLKYLEQQKKLVQNGKFMDAIQNDEDNITDKTSTTYSRALKEMKDYARTLNRNDFKIKN